MGKAVKRVLAVLLTIILLVVVVVGCYIAYLMITYNRIADKQPIDIENTQIHRKAGVPSNSPSSKERLYKRREMSLSHPGQTRQDTHGQRWTDWSGPSADGRGWVDPLRLHLPSGCRR